MVSESFSAHNFRQIFDYENRRGLNLEAKFFPEIEEVTRAIKVCMADIRGLKRQKRALLPEYYVLKKAILNEEKLILKKKKEELLTKELENISSEIASGNMRVGLQQVAIPGGKIAYAVDKTPKAYFIIKQLQQNVRKLYKVKQSSRYEIICQLKAALGDPFPKYIIRTDIRDFYESVSCEKLLRKLDEDALLTLPSRTIIRQILRDYQTLSGGLTGIPRGIGISAYLAELYMRQFDEAIRALDGIAFYARYVDDIVTAFSASPDSSATDLLPFVKEKAAVLGLKLNPGKTSEYDCRKPGKHELEYLGYKIMFGDGSVRVGLSTKRDKKYKSRIKRSFDVYARQAQLSEKKARRLLIKRIEFLAGNTRLLNNKANIMTGVFYSNSLLSSADELESIDRALRAQARAIKPLSLRNSLKRFSFQDGFLERRFRAFTTQELAEIVEIWKYEA